MVFQTTVKGAELSYEPYADMMGRSLTGLTVYTDQGIIEITLQNEKYVPIKQNYDITVTAPEVNATETTYAGTEPFANAQITVTDADDQEVEGITVDTVNKRSVGQKIWQQELISWYLQIQVENMRLSLFRLPLSSALYMY